MSASRQHHSRGDGSGPFTRRAAALTPARVGRRQVDGARAHLAALVEHSAEAILAVDRDLRVSSCNPAAERLFGDTAAQAAGRPLAGILGVKDGDGWRERLLRGEVLRFDARPGDGAPCAAVTLAPVRGPDGDVIGAVALARDVTAERTAAANLERTACRARFAARAAGLLTATLDRTSTAAAMTRLAVPELADLCAFVAYDRAAGRLRLAHVAAADAAVEQALASAARREVPVPDGSLATRVAATGEPLLLEAVPSTLPRLWKELYPELTGVMEALTPHSAMALPLHTEGELAGVLLLVSLRADRSYDAEDLAFAGEIAERVAQTLQRVRLHETAVAAKDAAEASERAARVSRDRFTAAFEHAPVGMALVNHAGPTATTVEVNAAMCELTGYSRAELIGRDPVEVFLHPDEQADARSRIARLGSGVMSYRVERRYVNRGGEPIWVHVHAAFVRDEGGPHVILQAVDVSERRRAEQALRTLNEELEARVAARTADVESANRELAAANRELEAFAYSAAHDLRAPLRAIDRFATTLGDGHAGPLTGDARRYVDLVRHGAHEMSALIDDLLAFSRVGLEAVRIELVDPAELVAAALAELADQRAGRSVTVTVGPLPRVRADRRLLMHVFTNLLANALKFTRGCDPARIEVGCEPGPWFYVRDSGIGFDQADAEQIFNVFRRLHPSEAYEGTGVGLALVKRVVERHGGSIWAEGEEGRGATFRFRLGDGDAAALGSAAPRMARP